jgi:hypothetical protein
VPKGRIRPRLWATITFSTYADSAPSGDSLTDQRHLSTLRLLGDSDLMAPGKGGWLPGYFGGLLLRCRLRRRSLGARGRLLNSCWPRGRILIRFGTSRLRGSGGWGALGTAEASLHFGDRSAIVPTRKPGGSPHIWPTCSLRLTRRWRHYGSVCFTGCVLLRTASRAAGCGSGDPPSLFARDAAANTSTRRVRPLFICSLVTGRLFYCFHPL